MNGTGEHVAQNPCADDVHPFPLYPESGRPRTFTITYQQKQVQCWLSDRCITRDSMTWIGLSLLTRIRLQIQFLKLQELDFSFITLQ